MDGQPAYVYYISPTQINVLAPDDSAVGAVQVQVTAAQVASNSFTAQKGQFSPGLFTMGGSYVAALHADYSLVGKPGLIAGATSTPAKSGETLSIYGTGFGPANPPLPSAQTVTTPTALANSVQFTIGGVAATVTYAGVAGSGLDQFNVKVPNVPNGDAAVVAQMGGVETQTGVLITVQSPPQIASLNPASGSPGSAVSLSIAGSNLSNVTGVQFTPSAGIAVSNVSATATQVSATVNIAASAAAGQASVTVSSPAGTSNSLGFTVLPSYGGQWLGTTVQSQTVTLTVVGSNVTAYSYGLDFGSLGSACPTGNTVTSAPATSIPITGSTFTTSTISGTFQSWTQVSGTINWSLSTAGCDGSGSVTWTAVKQ
jgi:uncharacterized protein (TIGR03437 family)